MRLLRILFGSIDWWLIFSVILLTFLGLVTMYTFDGDNLYFERQIWWIGIAVCGLIISTIPDYRFLRTGNTTFYIYLGILFLLVLVLFVGETVKGAQSRFFIILF